MLRLQQGTNRMVVPKQDLPNPLPDAVALRLFNGTTKREVWCALEDSGELFDWRDFVIEVKTFGADPSQGQIAMTDQDKGEWVATLFGGAVYSESPALLDQLREERCAY